MKNTTSKGSHESLKKEKKDNSEKTKSGSENGGLRELFINELRDIYWAEKALPKAIQKMIDKSTSEELIDALTNHLESTEGHGTRIEEIFSTLGEKAETKKCEAIIGIIKEAEGMMEDVEKGVVRDAGIILAAQKVEHYEIATYGTLCVFARTLGEEQAALLLEETLNEEKEADSKLSEIAEASVNIEAAE